MDQTEKAFKSDRKAMQTLINVSTETMILIDAEGRFLTINKIGAERLGKTHKQEITYHLPMDFRRTIPEAGTPYPQQFSMASI